MKSAGNTAHLSHPKSLIIITVVVVVFNEAGCVMTRVQVFVNDTMRA